MESNFKEYNFLEYSKEQLFSLLPELIKEKKVLLIRKIFDQYNIVDLRYFCKSFYLLRTRISRKINKSSFICRIKKYVR